MAIRGALMPLSVAASGLSAAARIAMPNRVRLRKSARPTRSTGVSSSIAMYAGPTGVLPMVNDGIAGGFGKVRPLSPCGLSSSASTSTNCDRPSVTTMPITRGAALEPADEPGLDQRADPAGDQHRQRERQPVRHAHRR